MIEWNKYDYNKWNKSGCPKNDKIKILNCNYNKLTNLESIKNLTKVMRTFN
jgi:hypothetical protein